MTTAALVLYVLALVVLFGVRSAVQHRRTGSTGFKGISGTPAEPNGGAVCCSSWRWSRAWPGRCWPFSA
jgi:hypothetical protein